MSRFFFHTSYKQFSADDEGVELADRRAAWKQATIAAGQILRDIDGELTPGREWRMDVTDDKRNILFSLKFSAEAYDI